MTENFIRGLSEEEKNEFFHSLIVKQGRFAALVGAIVAVIVSCAIILPVSIATNNYTNDTNRVNAQVDAQRNCDAIKELRGVMINIITYAETPKPGIHQTSSEIQAGKNFKVFSLKQLNSIKCF